MNFDPQKFFIGLMDFFSILLPGALLTYLLYGRVGPPALWNRYIDLHGPQAWIVFLFASYLFGHLIFLLGSWLDEFYDWARRYTLDKQIARLARRGRLLSWPARALVWLVFKRERNRAIRRVLKIKQQALGGLQAMDAVNAFQWSKALLNVESPASLAVVQRFEADSKFFRCFTVVLLILLAAWPFDPRWRLAGSAALLGLILLALWRYMEQRHKATNQAYWSVITIAARDVNTSIGKSEPDAGGPTHAGGVVFRIRRKRAEFLLVEATDDPDQWVLPKGHIEEGEQQRETAVREVYEETGVWACIAHELREVSYSVNGAVITVRFFLMRAVGRGLHSGEGRRHLWLSLEKAIQQASHLETRDLLQAAAVQIGLLPSAEYRRVRV